MIQEDKSMKNMTKLMKKIRKYETLETGRRQFTPLVRPTAYVFVNNVCLPVVSAGGGRFNR